jgi:hypothetical protein
MPRIGAAVAIALLLAALPAAAQRNIPVPRACTPQVNQRLATLLDSGQHRTVDNVMVCGTTISPSRHQRGRRHGAHEIFPLQVALPNSGVRLVEVVVNDDLDGIVTAPVRASVFAYGQAFFQSGGRFVAGIHDVHCSTHRGADNGWVVVNGIKHPVTCSR